MINNITLPSDMEIPDRRRDTTNPENVRWLLRNLGIRNQDHVGFKIAIIILKNLATSTT